MAVLWRHCGRRRDLQHPLEPVKRTVETNLTTPPLGYEALRVLGGRVYRQPDSELAWPVEHLVGPVDRGYDAGHGRRRVEAHGRHRAGSHIEPQPPQQLGHLVA